MPLVKRSISDMIEHFYGRVDFLVNPVNCKGSARSGLTKAFADRWPQMQSEYYNLCQENKVDIGSIIPYVSNKTVILNLPTKNEWMDVTINDNLEIACLNLSNYLSKYPLHTVAMPALGIGFQKADILEIDPILVKHLNPLPNIIHVSIRPDRFEEPPLYLAVVGSRKYTDYDKIDIGVQDGFIHFEKTFNDFEAIISGGANGVDKIACGSGSDDSSMNIAKQHNKKSIVCFADWERYGNSAGFIRNQTVADIATHVVVFVGSKSVGTRNLIELIHRHNKYVDKLASERSLLPIDDIFSKPLAPLPEKKMLYIHDISSISE